MAGPLGKLQVVLGLDAREFSAGIGKAKADVGGFGTGAKVAFGVAAGAAALGFGLMAKGSQEMERSQGAFMAATGRSRDEAKLFAKDMNSLVGTAATVGMSFDDISKAGVQVAQQFGKTGAEGTKLTADFLTFAKVTGQDAAGAVDSFDAALDAFGEPAERATSLMDQLVASNQKYGTDAGPAALAALQGMAPALQAMGAGLDDGVGLLNLFESAGLDASAAQAGLKKAIAELKPGETLNDLIAQISSIEDPTLRAQEAMRIFGARSGVGLANAMQPGMDSLDDFIPAIEDVEGASRDAAENMLTTGDKIRMFAEKAGAALRGLGQDFGPMLSGLGAIGSLAAPFAKSLTGLFTGLLRHVGILAAATAVGTATGGAQAAGHEAAATGPGVIKSLALKIGAMSIPLAGAGTTVGTAVGGAMALGMATALATGGLIALQAFYDNILKPGMGANGPQAFDAALATQMAASGANAGTAAGQAYAPAYLAELTANLPVIPQEWWDASLAGAAPAGTAAGTAAGATLSEALADSVVSGFQSRWPAGTAFEVITQDLRDEMEEAHRIAAWGGEQTPGAFSQTLRSGFDTVRSAFTDLKDLMKNTLSPIQQEAELIAIATHRRMARALADGRPEVRSQAQQIALDTLAQLHRLAPGSEEIGALSMRLLAGATAAEKPAIRDAIAAIVGAARTALNPLPGIAETAGEDTGAALARGLRNKFGSVSTAANQLAGIVRGRLELNSPAKEGPWSKNGGPIGWFQSMGRRMMKGLNAEFATEIHPPSFGSFKRSAVDMPIRAIGGVASSEQAPVIHLHIGTLIADEAGLAELQRRMEHAAGFGFRTRMPLAGASY